MTGGDPDICCEKPAGKTTTSLLPATREVGTGFIRVVAVTRASGPPGVFGVNSTVLWVVPASAAYVPFARKQHRNRRLRVSVVQHKARFLGLCRSNTERANVIGLCLLRLCSEGAPPSTAGIRKSSPLLSSTLD